MPKCFASSCAQEITPGRIFCVGHRRLVPAPLWRDVERAHARYRQQIPGSSYEYFTACRAARAAVAAAETPERTEVA